MSKHINLSGLKTLLEPLVHLINKKAERPDWNENDPSSPDYIENRPFYEETEFTEYTINVDNEFTSYDVSLPSFIEGKTYNIIWDGVKYSCVAYIAEHADVPMIGNDLVAGAGNTGGNGEPFGILVYDGQNLIFASTLGTHTLGIGTSVIHRIDEKYLPEISSVGKKATANGAEIFNDYMNNWAGGEYSHAEGYDTDANGHYSHAEGYNTTVTGYAAHAEGQQAKAMGTASHAEGNNTQAQGFYSHAEGNWTTASDDSQHVEGRYNISDTSSAHILGNGNDTSNRSNAHTIDWDGNAWFAKNVYVGSTSGKNRDAGSKMLATENYVTDHVTEYVDEALSSFDGIIFVDKTTKRPYMIAIDNGEIVISDCVKSISVTVPPNVTQYCDGSFFDPTGMTVIATYYDGTSAEITDYSYQTSPLVTGQTSVKIKKDLSVVDVPVTVTAFNTAILKDFGYSYNTSDGKYQITSWRGTTNGMVGSTEIIVPDNIYIKV